MTGAARWHEFAYEQTEIPAGMTVGDWRTQGARTRPTSRRWSRIIGVLSRSARRLRGTGERRDAPRDPVPGRHQGAPQAMSDYPRVDRLAAPRPLPECSFQPKAEPER